MADEVREYVRAAQAAEIKGDKAQAVELLRKAATLYRNQGNAPRALQMLRHARRLDGDSEELRNELARMEWIPERPMATAAGEEADAEKAVSMLDVYASTPQLIERGPTRADPALAAWCSFCCRPKTEVGDLVAGPAGAFICATCVGESQRLLGIAPAGPPAIETVAPAAAPSPTEFVGQAEAVALLDAAWEAGARVALLLGPAGTGKTTYLAHLAARGRGFLVTELAQLASAPPDQRLLIDLDASANGADLLAAVGERPALVAARAERLDPSLALSGDEAELPVYSSQALIAATGGRLPVGLAERVQGVAAFRALTAPELEEIARQHLSRRASELDLSDELVVALARAAADSPRQGHELKSLVERIPPGSWNVKAPPAKKKSRKKAKS